MAVIYVTYSYEQLTFIGAPPCSSRVYIPNIHPSFPNTCISCVKRQYPSRTLKLSHIELCQYCRGGPDGKPGSCIPFSFFIQHSTMDQMDTPPEDLPPPRIGRSSTHARILLTACKLGRADTIVCAVPNYGTHVS